MWFVRGKYSAAPYSFLESPLSAGGLNCPSLITRKSAYDLKLLSDLISSPQDAPWRVWMAYDLSLSTAPDHRFVCSGLNPFLQNSHTRFYRRLPDGSSQRTMSDCLSDTFATSWLVGIGPRCSFPSLQARLDYPILCHPALPKVSTGRSHDRLASLGITTVGNLFAAPAWRLPRPALRVVSCLLVHFSLTPWDPSFVDHPRTASLNIWPAMRSPSGCVRFLTAPYSIVTTSEQLLLDHSPFRPYLTPRNPVVPCPARPTIPVSLLWISSSFMSDGPEVYSSGVAWSSNWCISTSASLSSTPLDPKLACLASLIFALTSWRSGNVTIHTDSSFVTQLADGGLLRLERDGWPSFPWLALACSPAPSQLRSILQHALFLLRSHSGSLSFVLVPSGHPDDKLKFLHNLAEHSRTHAVCFRLDTLRTPPNWVDDAPVLNYQSLSFITSTLVERRIPLPILSYRMSSFADRWTVLMWHSFHTQVDLGSHIPHIWHLNAPAGFKELVWKHIFGSLPIGLSRQAKSSLGLDFCPCGDTRPVDLYHILCGCLFFPVSPLWDSLLHPALLAAAPAHTSHASVDPNRWYQRWWFPVLCLKHLAMVGSSPPDYRALCRSIRKREWIVCSFLWVLWCHRMKLAHELDYFFSTDNLTDIILSRLSDAPR